MIPAIQIRNVTKKYRNAAVLKGVNLEIAQGDFYCLMGPNGSGKTTLASMIASVRSPSSGTIEILGRSPQIARAFIGYVPQENFSSPLLTGRENLSYFMEMHGYNKKQRRLLVDTFLQETGLWDDADKRVSKYSGGMRKRLEVSTALLPNIEVLILDEPTTGLDPSARRNFFELIQRPRKQTTTILLITHIGSDAEAASTVGFMSAGEIVAEGSPEHLAQSSGLSNAVYVETQQRNEEVRRALNRYSSTQEALESDEGYRLYCPEADRVLPDIVRSLDAVGCRATNVSVRRPSLEDVFYALTGQQVRKGD